MKKKIICIGIIGIFLLSSIMTVTAVDLATVCDEKETAGYVVYNNDFSNMIKKVEFLTNSPADFTKIGEASAGSLNDALDNYDLTFTNTGVSDWEYYTGESFEWFEGRDSAKSGILGIGETCMLETTVEGPSLKLLRFAVAIRSTYKDSLKFYYDGECIGGIIGPPPYEGMWSFFTVQIPEGSHTFGWGFTNEGGNGYGLLDYVVYRDLSYNNPPDKPDKPNGFLKIGLTGFRFMVSYQISGDPDRDDINFTVDWGDGTTTTSKYYHFDKGAYTNVDHIYNKPGMYKIKFLVQDIPNPLDPDNGLAKENESDSVKIIILGWGILAKLLERFRNG